MFSPGSRSLRGRGSDFEDWCTISPYNLELRQEVGAELVVRGLPGAWRSLGIITSARQLTAVMEIEPAVAKLQVAWEVH